MLRDDLTHAMKEAMKSKDRTRLSTIRLILAAVKEKDIEDRSLDNADRDDDAIITDILSKMVKQRGDSIKAYEEAGRCELAEQEREEISIIQTFLPRQLSDDELKNACVAIVSEIGAEGLKDIGRCMGALKAKYAGQMDFAKASLAVKELLA
ncbi:GatB/YqeY domain-containing protein [Kordiimonas sp. SCSIO 12610]|uniref:GatB/YqeY domain-containing protein n=1 Tax=Kordiimonas sp. SCSIO 12610 TaxID=2829597 RepID=UPI00210A634B|nr:GatB/YqeY domain-containing protein [Kordiimonas sp. SCSIO 12610]UTW54947.1 GatB/YqeY domain-containing protein [Kordiimonas sp. SCSIO 12610]